VFRVFIEVWCESVRRETSACAGNREKRTEQAPAGLARMLLTPIPKLSPSQVTMHSFLVMCSQNPGCMSKGFICFNLYLFALLSVSALLCRRRLMDFNTMSARRYTAKRVPLFSLSNPCFQSRSRMLLCFENLLTIAILHILCRPYPLPLAPPPSSLHHSGLFPLIDTNFIFGRQ